LTYDRDSQRAKISRGNIVSQFTNTISDDLTILQVNSINQSIIVYYGMTKCRPTTLSKKGNTVSKKKAGLEKKIVPKKSLRPSSIVTSS